MNYFTKSSIGALMLIGIAGPAMAQSNTSSASAAGSITVYQPLTLSSDVNLAFGRVVRPSVGTGSVAIANDGTPSFTNGVVGLTSTRSAARFTVTGEGASLVTLVIPATATLNNTSGTGSLTVNLTHDVAAPANTQLNGSLGTTGTNTFHVGGSIAIADTTSSGAYSGSFNVTATYN
jgi:hypothetical protein